MDVAQLVEPLPRKYKDRDLIPSPGKLGVVQLTRNLCPPEYHWRVKSSRSSSTSLSVQGHPELETVGCRWGWGWLGKRRRRDRRKEGRVRARSKFEIPVLASSLQHTLGSQRTMGLR